MERIWAWKDEYEQRILSQLRLMGCSCDWERTRFTLDEVCSRAVRRTFFNLFKAGKIFRGKRLVNWDTQLRTAVADDEIYYEETQGHLWTIKYPVADSPRSCTSPRPAPRPCSATRRSRSIPKIPVQAPRRQDGRPAADRAARSRSSPIQCWSTRPSVPGASR